MENETVEKIIDLLCDRGGFDDWWYNIDVECQNEIKNSIEEIIKINNKF